MWRYGQPSRLESACINRVPGPNHYARDCQAQAMKCYACGKLGHISRECSAPNGGPLSTAGKTCYKCGEAGEIEIESPKLCIYLTLVKATFLAIAVNRRTRRQMALPIMLLLLHRKYLNILRFDRQTSNASHSTFLISPSLLWVFCHFLSRHGFNIFGIFQLLYVIIFFHALNLCLFSSCDGKAQLGI